jgi:hypothetical protein
LSGFLDDAKGIFENAAADTAKANWIGDALTGGAGDGKGTKALTTITNASIRGAILDKNAATHLSRHSAQVVEVL